MAHVKQGDTVKIHYVGTLGDGTVFDSSVVRDELIEFTVGNGRLLPDFETGVVGMSPGESNSSYYGEELTKRQHCSL